MRDDRADALFGHLDRSNANLRVALSRLRSALRDATFVESGAGGYRLTDGAVVDADEFEGRADAGHEALVAGRFEKAHTELEAALALYRGDLAQGEASADWAEPLRVRLRAKRVDALDDLADAFLAPGRQRDAAATAERAIELERTRESAYRRLMTARYTAGEQDAALAAYERCRHALSAELRVHPLP